MTKDIQLYGEGKALKQMAWRVKHCVPNGNRLQDHEAMSLAQVSLATGLNPFTGEVWYIPGKGPMAGIRGLRRRAKEQSTYSVDPRAMRADELEEHMVKEEDVGRICALYRHDVLAKAVEINKAAGEQIIPVRPVIGIGIWRKGDQIPSGKSPAWVADKRAEADALRKAFDLAELAYSDEVNGALEIADDDEWEVVPDEVVRREVARNAERREAVEKPAPAPPEEPEDYGPIVGEYLAGEREIPDWLADIKKAIEADPKASEPIGQEWTGQVTQMALEYISFDAFKAFLRILFKKADYRPEEMTFGAVRVLKPIIADNGDFKERVEELLS